MLSRLRAQLPAWRRALRRRRRILALLALAVTAAALLPAYLPPSAQGVTVVVAKEDLPPGTILAPEDLHEVRIAADLVPAGSAHVVQELSGRTTTIPVSAGTPLLPGLLEDEATPPVPADSVLMLVPAPAALVPHLPPGTRIELLWAGPATAETQSVPAQVVELGRSEEGTGAAGFDVGGTGSAQLLVAVDRADSRDVAHALTGGTTLISIIG